MNYNFEYIDKLRIHELRDYARKLGVSSPTTLKKEELLNSIFEIISKNDINKTESSVVGKEGLDFYALLLEENSSILQDLLDDEKHANKNKGAMLIDKKALNVSNYSSFNNEPFIYSLSQNVAQYDIGSVVCLSGYIDIHPNGYGILRYDGFVPNDNDAFLTSAIVRKHNLKKGMFITANAKYVIEGKPRVAFEVTSIQDKNLFKGAVDFDNAKAKGLGEELYLDKFDISIKLGERHYVNTMSLEDAIALSYDIVEENGVYLKFINLKSKPEDMCKSDDKLEVINVPFNKIEVEVINTIDLVLERIKREFEIGKSNILLIYNFSELVRYVNLAYEGCYENQKFNAKTINKIHNILYTAKYVSQNNSCTILCVDPNGIRHDVKTIIEYEFLPLFNKIHDVINKK